MADKGPILCTTNDGQALCVLHQIGGQIEMTEDATVKECLTVQTGGGQKELLKNNSIGLERIFFLICGTMFRYTKCNIAATPLNNAQPWRLFLCLNSGGLHA